MKKAMRKLKKRSGFTLAEVLVAILILLMVSSIVAAGIPAAKSAYEKVVIASNAEVLLSTTISVLRNELGTGTVIKMLDGNGNETANTSGEAKGLLYYNSRTGAPSKIWFGTAEGQSGSAIWYQRYADTDLSLGGETTRLVSKEVATEGLSVVYDSVTYDGSNIIIFDKLEVKNGTGENAKTVAARGGTGKFSIRVIDVNLDNNSMGVGN